MSQKLIIKLLFPTPEIINPQHMQSEECIKLSKENIRSHFLKLPNHTDFSLSRLFWIPTGSDNWYTTAFVFLVQKTKLNST